MGSADVVPGVSGGTVAFLTGIYGRLIAAISALRPPLAGQVLRGRWREVARTVDLPFLLSLALGIVLALGTFTRIIPLPALIDRYPETVYAIFFGLILGACVTLLGSSGKRTPAALMALVIGFVVALPVLTAVPDSTPDSPLFLAVAGACALSAMILPGISGSFVLLMLGKYSTVLEAVGHLELQVLLPFAVGGAIGFLTLANLLSWLIRHHEVVVTHVMVGILFASLAVIWPFQHRTFAEVHGKMKLVSTSPYLPDTPGPLLVAALLALAGFAAVISAERLARHQALKRRR